MRAKTYSFLINDGSEDKKAKATNKCVIKGKRKAEEAQLENKIIALISNDDKRMQSIGSIETCAYETSKELACKKKETKGNNIMKHYQNV